MTLRIAAHEQHDFFATLFSDEVRRLSKGRIHIRFIPGTPDNEPADAPVRFARQVRDGAYDLGVIESPAWDELGVRSFEALQAPLLIRDESLFHAVLASPLADRMLAGVRAQHVVGLGLMVNYLQHPVGDRGPLAAPPDFAGKHILAPVSHVNDAVLGALGATPVHASFAGLDRAFAHHQIDGQLMPAFARPNVWLTANVSLSATVLTLIANEHRFAQLSDEQQRIVRAAAARAAQRAAGVMASDPEAGLVTRHCQRGRVVFATPAQLAALAHALQPVYAQLERDPQVKATIAAIHDLARRTSPDPTPKIPASCSRTAPASHARERDPSFLDGTYRWRITREGAIRAGGRADDPVIGMIVSMTLRGGRWAEGDSSGGDSTGTFTVIGDRIAFTWPAKGYTNTFTLKRRPDGTLDLAAVLPMDAGDRVVMSSSSWRRIGPPVRSVR